MARNVYFNDKVRSEQNLYEDIVIESLKIYGQEVYYLPRDIVQEDRIFGDDIPSRFNSSHKIEMYIENIEGFDGEGDLFTRFGVEIRDEATFVVSRRRWTQAVARMDGGVTSVRPLEGDLIYLPLSNKLFQIMHVEHEQPFYQQSALPTFKLSCTRFEYSSERLDTGISTIDSVEDSLSTDTMNFQFTLENEVGSFLLESDTGEISYIINEDFTMATQSPNDQGKTFETEAGTTTSSTGDDILDFSERNPFGEVDEY